MTVSYLFVRYGSFRSEYSHKHTQDINRQAVNLQQSAWLPSKPLQR